MSSNHDQTPAYLKDLFDGRPCLTPDALSNIDRLESANVELSASERMRVGDNLATHESYCTRLLAKRDEVQAILQSLAVETTHIQQSISKMKRVLHPIRGVPNEILHVIFSFCIDEANDLSSERLIDQLYFTNITDSREHPAWILSHVCSRWRDVVLSSPLMWSTINLQLHNANTDSFSTLSLIRLIISRSQASPLSLALIDSDYSMQLAKSSSLADIFAHSKRWKALTLAASTRALHVLEYAESGFEQLESLHFSLCLPSNNRQFLGFMGASRLTNVSVDSGLVEFRRFLEIPWSQLTDITLGTASADDVAGLLQGMPKLVTADFLFRQMAGDPSIENTVIESSTIHTFTLRYRGTVAPLINALRLPALKSLRILHSRDDAFAANCNRARVYYTDRTGSDSGILPPLPDSIGSGLKHLVVTILGSDGPPAFDNLKTLLESAPVVEALGVRLIGTETMDDLIAFLDVSSTDPWVAASYPLHSLTSLEIFTPNRLPVRHSLVGMLLSRLQDTHDIANLRSLRVGNVLDVPEDVKSLFDGLVAQGNIDATFRNIPQS